MRTQTMDARSQIVNGREGLGYLTSPPAAMHAGPVQWARYFKVSAIFVPLEGRYFYDFMRMRGRLEVLWYAGIISGIIGLRGR